MVKTVWECETCGQSFNSRAARLYHKRTKHPEQPIIENGEGNIGATSPEPSPTEQLPATVPESTQKAPLLTRKQEYEQEFGVTIPPVPGVETEPAPVTATQSDEEIPVFFVLIGAVVLLIIAGIVVFRERLLALMGRGRPPNPVAAGGYA